MKYSRLLSKYIYDGHSPVVMCALLMLIFGLITSCHSPSQDDTTANTGSIDSLDYYTKVIASPVSENKNRAFLQRARLFYQKNAYDAALKDIKSALSLDSTQLGAYLLKSRVELDYFRSMDALRTLQKAKQIWPESFRISVDLAQTYLILRQYEKARLEAQRALAIQPLSARPYLILGMVSKENKDTSSAITFLQEAVQNDADLLDAWIELARLHMEVDPGEAAPYFESALQIAPEELRIWHAYAMYWQNQDSLKKAQNTYSHMIRIDSQYLEAYYNQALLLMDQDSFGKAIPIWDQFIQRKSNPAKGFYYRGICFEMDGNYSAALENYTKAKELNPALENIDGAILSMRNRLKKQRG